MRDVAYLFKFIESYPELSIILIGWYSANYLGMGAPWNELVVKFSLLDSLIKNIWWNLDDILFLKGQIPSEMSHPFVYHVNCDKISIYIIF